MVSPAISFVERGLILFFFCNNAFLSDLSLVVTILGILAGCFGNRSLLLLSGLQSALKELYV